MPDQTVTVLRSKGILDVDVGEVLDGLDGTAQDLHGAGLTGARVEAAQQRRQGNRRVLLQIVHQDDAFALLVELGHDVLDDLVGTRGLEIVGIDVAGKHRDV